MVGGGEGVLRRFHTEGVPEMRQTTHKAWSAAAVGALVAEMAHPLGEVAAAGVATVWAEAPADAVAMTVRAVVGFVATGTVVYQVPNRAVAT